MNQVDNFLNKHGIDSWIQEFKLACCLLGNLFLGKAKLISSSAGINRRESETSSFMELLEIRAGSLASTHIYLLLGDCADCFF